MGTQSSFPLNCGNNESDPQDKLQSNHQNQYKNYFGSSNNLSNQPLKQGNGQFYNLNIGQQYIIKIGNMQFENSHYNNLYHIFEQNTGKSLAKIIQTRISNKRRNITNNPDNMHPNHFNQLEIMNVMKSLVYALAYLHKNNLRHHNFHPSTIFQSQNCFKLSHPNTVQSSYLLTSQSKRFSFLSPQLIIQLLQQCKQSQIPSPILYQADVFAIGMIMLEVCTLKASGQCYDEQNYNILDMVIKDRLNQVHAFYGPECKRILESMLQYELDNRIKIDQLVYLVNIALKEIEKRPKSKNQGHTKLVSYSTIPTSNKSISFSLPEMPSQPHGYHQNRPIDNKMTYKSITSRQPLSFAGHTSSVYETPTMQQKILLKENKDRIYSNSNNANPLMSYSINEQSHTPHQFERTMPMFKKQDKFQPNSYIRTNSVDLKNDSTQNSYYPPSRKQNNSVSKTLQKYQHLNKYSPKQQKQPNLYKASNNKAYSKQQTLQQRVQRILSISRTLQ